MTMAGCFPELGEISAWLVDAFNPNDRENLAPYRVPHLLTATLVVTRFTPKDWPGLHWRIFRPLIICGQQSFAVFCLVFLSFAAHFALLLSWGSLLAQFLVSAAGLAIMTLAAYYISWSKRQDDPSGKPPPHGTSIDAHF